jgi:recombination protein RecA
LAKKVLELVRSKNAIPPEAPIIIVFDSLASMVPKSKYAKDVEDHGMNDSLALARATSAEMPLLSDLAYFNNALLLFLNQTRDKIGGYVPTIETPGGNAPKFYSSVRVMLSAKKLVDKPTGENKGQEVTANVIKNKVARPFQKTSWQFVYDSEGRGNVDVTGSLLSHLIDEDVIKQNGPRIEWEGKNYLKHQLLESLGGSEKAFEVFKSMLKD